MTSQNTPAWRNDDLEGAVIGAFFLHDSTGIFTREFADRPVYPASLTPYCCAMRCRNLPR